MVALTFSLNITNANAASTCAAMPTCAAMGYTQTSCPSGITPLKCPFDETKLFCGAGGDCEALGYTKTSCEVDEEVFKCPFDASKLKCVMNCSDFNFEQCNNNVGAFITCRGNARCKYTRCSYYKTINNDCKGPVQCTTLSSSGNTNTKYAPCSLSDDTVAFRIGSSEPFITLESRSKPGGMPISALCTGSYGDYKESFPTSTDIENISWDVYMTELEKMGKPAKELIIPVYDGTTPSTSFSKAYRISPWSKTVFNGSVGNSYYCVVKKQ